jgi:hypothetical protein
VVVVRRLALPLFVEARFFMSLLPIRDPSVASRRSATSVPAPGPHCGEEAQRQQEREREERAVPAQRQAEAEQQRADIEETPVIVLPGEFVALRDIAAGEEVTTNYNGDPDNSKPVWFDAQP